jgi:hypothetical protein
MLRDALARAEINFDAHRENLLKQVKEQSVKAFSPPDGLER